MVCIVIIHMYSAFYPQWDRNEYWPKGGDYLQLGSGE